MAKDIAKGLHYSSGIDAPESQELLLEDADDLDVHVGTPEDLDIANNSGAVTSLHGVDEEEKESSGGCQGRCDEFNVHIHLYAVYPYVTIPAELASQIFYIRVPTEKSSNGISVVYNFLYLI